MNSISDLYLFPLNQLVLSPTHSSHTGVPSIIDLCSSQAIATHWNTYQPHLFSSRRHPPSINLYPILSSLLSLQHQNSLFFIPPATELWNSLLLHIRISSSLSTLRNTYSTYFTLLLLSHPWQQSTLSFHLVIIYVFIYLFIYLFILFYYYYFFFLARILQLSQGGKLLWVA